MRGRRAIRSIAIIKHRFPIIFFAHAGSIPFGKFAFCLQRHYAITNCVMGWAVTGKASMVANTWIGTWLRRCHTLVRCCNIFFCRQFAHQHQVKKPFGQGLGAAFCLWQFFLQFGYRIAPEADTFLCIEAKKFR